MAVAIRQNDYEDTLRPNKRARQAVSKGKSAVQAESESVAFDPIQRNAFRIAGEGGREYATALGAERPWRPDSQLLAQFADGMVPVPGLTLCGADKLARIRAQRAATAPVPSQADGAGSDARQAPAGGRKRCPQRHPLTRLSTAEPGWDCDLCGQEKPTGAWVAYCKACSWSCCVPGCKSKQAKSDPSDPKAKSKDHAGPSAKARAKAKAKAAVATSTSKAKAKAAAKRPAAQRLEEEAAGRRRAEGGVGAAAAADRKEKPMEEAAAAAGGDQQTSTEKAAADASVAGGAAAAGEM